MRKLRLTMFIGLLSVGGAQQMVCELVKKLDRNRVDIHVICYEGRAYTRIEREIEAYCTVTYLDAKGKVTLSKVKHVFSAIKKSKPDVVHAHLGGMVYVVPWVLLNKTPLLITAHAKPSMAFPSVILPLIKYGIAKQRIYIAAVSEKNQKLLQDFMQVEDERIVCVNNGIDIDCYYKLQHDYFTYINVARQDENKNQAAIIRAFAEIIQRGFSAKLILVGNGPTHESLKTLVDELNITDAVEFPGEVSDVERFYAVSDVYIQSSHREAMPMSVLEAMAAGLPIISTDVGGLRDVVQGNGILVQDNDEEALCEAMQKFIEFTESEITAMRRKTKALVSRYSSDTMAARYMDLYSKMDSKGG